MPRATKIVATIGPTSSSSENILRLLQAGMNVARLNFSHGLHSEHAAVYNRLRLAADQLGRSICILQDLQGPKIRTGQMPEGGVLLTAGQAYTLTTRPIMGSSQAAPVDFPELLDCVQPGSRILLDDGSLELRVTKIGLDQVESVVTLGGVLKSHKGINLPGAAACIPGFTPKDQADLAFGLELGVDVVAVSFVRQAEDILKVRQAIRQQQPDRAVPIIAKLERPEALDNLDSILAAADGVMVARGDLGVEMSPEVVPIAQKQVISAANRSGKLVITATQMLDSMITHPRPTRAEASDVANAIFDGTDAVMLSGETAAGQYPIESVEMMSAIIQQAEAHTHEWGRWQGQLEPGDTGDDTYYITRAAHELACDRNVAAICIFTRTGRSALLMAKARPDRPILAFSPQQDTCQRLNLAWGVTPHHSPGVNSLEEMVAVVDRLLLAQGAIEPGQQVVLICGFPIPAIKPTNLALLHRVGEPV